MRRITPLAGLILMALAACSGDPALEREQFVDAAKRFQENGEYESAVINYRNALQADPSHVPTRLAFAELLRKRGEHQNAYNQFARVLEIDSGNLRAKLQVGKYLLSSAGRSEETVERARQLAREVLDKEPDNLEARILLGNAYAGLSDFEQSIEEMEQVLAADPNNLAATLNMAVFRMGMRQPEEARKIFAEAVERHPDEPDAHRAMANFHLFMKEFDQAEQSFMKAFELDPSSTRNLRNLMRLYLLTDQREKIEGLVERASEASENDFWPRFLLANYRISEGDRQKGVEELKRLVEDHPGQRLGSLRLAEIHLLEKDFEKAEQIVSDLFGENDLDPEGIYLRGRIHESQGRPDEALADFNKALELNDNMLPAYLHKANVHLMRNEFELAQNAVAQVLARARNHIGARSALAKILTLKGQRRDALQEASVVLQVQPNNTDALLARAESLLGLQRLDEAEEAYRRLTELQPGKPFPLQRLGSIAAVRHDYQRALEHFEKALELSPGNVEIINDIIFTYLEMGRQQQAMERIQGLLARADRNRDDLLVFKARVHQNMGDTDKAEQALRQALEVDASNPEAYMFLAQLQMEKGDLAKAVAEMDRLIESDPESVQAHLLKAFYLERQGKEDQAIEYYRKTLGLEPRNALANNNLAWIFCQRDSNLQEALELASTARREEPENPEYADTLGWIHFKRGNLNQATDLLLFSVNNRDEPRAEHYYRLGMAYFRKGETELAKQTLSRALELDASFKGAEQARQALEELS